VEAQIMQMDAGEKKIVEAEVQSTKVQAMAKT
jgi:hypothetical protein